LISRSMSRTNGLTNGKSSTPRTTEKIVSDTAMGAMIPRSIGPSAVSVTTPQFGKSAWPSGTSTGSANGISRSEPKTLESVCASAVRRASAVPPTAARHAVTVVPMFAPKRMAIAVSYVISCCAASVMAMAIVAAEWIAAERIAAKSAMTATSKRLAAWAARNAARTAS